MDENFGVYTYQTVDGQTVCNIYVGGPGNTDEATAQAAAAKLKQDHVAERQAEARTRNGVGRRWTMFVCPECHGGAATVFDADRACDCPDDSENPDYEYATMDMEIVVERVE